MPSIRVLRGIANDMANRFVSRNNDVSGYWALGKLLQASTQSNLPVFRLDLLQAQLDPNLRQFDEMVQEYAGMLREQLALRKIEPNRVTRAELQVSFHQQDPGAKPERQTHRCVCTVEMEDDHGRIFSGTAHTRCAAHSVFRESRSSRKKRAG